MLHRIGAQRFAPSGESGLGPREDAIAQARIATPRRGDIPGRAEEDDGLEGYGGHLIIRAVFYGLE